LEENGSGYNPDFDWPVPVREVITILVVELKPESENHGVNGWYKLQDSQ
jgi:hypothetical protein